MFIWGSLWVRDIGPWPFWLESSASRKTIATFSLVGFRARANPEQLGTLLHQIANLAAALQN